MTQQERHYCQPDEIAERFQVSLSYVYFLIRKKKIRSVRIGRLHRIPRKEYCRICRRSNRCIPCSYQQANFAIYEVAAAQARFPILRLE